VFAARREDRDGNAMPRRWLALLGPLLLIAGGCGGGERSASSRAGADTASKRPAPRIDTTPARCEVGERPGYFVPGPAGGRLALLGCARLGVSGKRVEFSGNLDRIGGARQACINPAYSGRGRRGQFIPALCGLEPPLSRFAVRAAAQPRQGVGGYAFVIWGTAGASTGVTARFAEGSARAVLIDVPAVLARSFGEPPFSLFVMELPLAAACRPVTVAARGSDATRRIPAQTKLCEASRR
jgi:hypothetical protein